MGHGGYRDTTKCARENATLTTARREISSTPTQKLELYSITSNTCANCRRVQHRQTVVCLAMLYLLPMPAFQSSSLSAMSLPDSRTSRLASRPFSSPSAATRAGCTHNSCSFDRHLNAYCSHKQTMHATNIVGRQKRTKIGRRSEQNEDGGAEKRAGNRNRSLSSK